uniref:hypothetical protein n=1 Tax=Desulfonatronovibrio magnus TaxID=698827 RepID=UPI0005EB6483
SRKAYISRRLLGMLLKSMGEKLTSTSPTASRTPDSAEVMQMEHIAAVVNRKPGKVPETESGSKEPASYYATEAQIQAQEETLTLGLKSVDAEPIAGLALPRTEAHQVLRLLRDQADKAGWGLEVPAEWMRPMEYGCSSTS